MAIAKTSKIPLSLVQNAQTKRKDAAKTFDLVAAAFDGDRHVTRGPGGGFGSGALKVKGKIFAMISSKGRFVVKLPRQRVDELIASGQGERFDPGHGRLIKEWLTVGGADWLAFAREACDFGKGHE